MLCSMVEEFRRFKETRFLHRSIRLLPSKMVHVYRRFKGTFYLVINSTRVYINDRGTGVPWNVTFLRNDTAFFQKAVIFAVMAVRILNRIMLIGVEWSLVEREG